jgi:arylsulfatase A-like enzyme
MAILVAIQIGNFYGYLLPAGTWNWASAGYLFTIPFIQAQNLIVAALLGLLVWLCGRIAEFVLFLAAVLFSLADQVYFKVFLDHIHLSLFEGGQGFNPGLLLSSFAREQDRVFWIAVVVALLGAFAVVRQLAPPPRIVVAIALLLELAGLPAFASKGYFNLNDNPLWSFAADWSRGSLADLMTDVVGKADGNAPAVVSGIDHDPRLPAFATGGKRNVILIILESVGAKNLLPFTDATPNLAALARHGVLFTDLYAPIPASVRSLISIHTGGADVALGGGREMRMRYTGPTLPGEFRKRGYAASFISSESLNGEYADQFLLGLGFDYLYDFANEPAENKKKYAIHSWGAQELYTLGLLESWIEERKSKPFLLEYYTAATHHPYGAPKDFPPFAAPGDPHNDYLNALHYSDYAIGKLVEFLKAKGLMDNTVIAVTGDHGEAFGGAHPRNRLHREFIYEDNVRDFLLLSGNLPEGITSKRAASNGALMSTLLAAATGEKGKNLLAEDFEQSPVFVYKMASPEQWGLRDGKWKFISEIRSGYAELYDLSVDPDELHDVSGEHRDLVERYQILCRRYMASKTAEYRTRITN